MFTHEDLDFAQGKQLRLYAKNIGLKGRSKLKVKELKDALRATLPPRQGTPPGLFVELCAGTAAVSLQLHREGAKPPVSRMGSKRGYAIAVLHALGLHPGLQADRYLWCEPDDGCRLLLETYRDHDLALKVAEIIRGWKDEDPRALWERLRKEGPVKAPTPREVARWVYTAGSAYVQGNPKTGFAGPGANGGRMGDVRDRSSARLENLDELPAEVTDGAVDPREVARWTLALPGGAWTCMPPKPVYKGPGAKPSRPKSLTQTTVAARYENLDTFPAEITDEAVDPREVARWCLDTAWSAGNDAGNGGFRDSYGGLSGNGRVICLSLASASARCEDLPTIPAEVTDEAVDPREVARWFMLRAWTAQQAIYCGPGHGRNRWGDLPIPNICKRVEDLPTVPGEITDGAVEPPLLPPNTVVYIDPPYVNTTGYKHDLPRERVVELALAWYAAGAKVAISEQEAIPELIAQGWTAVDITDKRLGQKRTFSVQKTEYLTLSPGTKCSNHLT
jgi:hypothetical protein